MEVDYDTSEPFVIMVNIHVKDPMSKFGLPRKRTKLLSTKEQDACARYFGGGGDV